MSALDDDLAREADEPSARPGPELRPVSLGTAPVEKPKGNLKLLVGLIVAAGGVVAMVFSLNDAAVYAKRVPEVMASQASFVGKALRIEGGLVKGSLVIQNKPCEYRFRVADDGVEMPVRFAQCVVPDTFRDMPGMDVRVTVEGKLAQNGTFEASQIVAKCPSKYEMKNRAQQGEAAPHSMNQPGASNPVN